MAFDERNIEIINFLDDIYCIKEGLFFTRFDDVNEWGGQISIMLAEIFNYDQEFCRSVLQHWAYDKGMSFAEWEMAWHWRLLKTTWSSEMAQDLASYGVIDAEAHLIALLSEQISAEINSEILKELSKQAKNTEEFISVVKCVGYEPTEPRQNMHTFQVRRGFKSMSYNDIKHERKSNHIWQDYIRPTRADDQTQVTG